MKNINPNRNLGGRPPKKEYEKASKKVTSNLTPTEYSLLENRHISTKQSIALIVRNAILRYLKSGHQEPRKFTAEEFEFMKNLTILNSTLNQIAKKLNSRQDLTGLDQVDLVMTINEISNDIEFIKEKI